MNFSLSGKSKPILICMRREPGPGFAAGSRAAALAQ